jgi:hypothetical protein
MTNFVDQKGITNFLDQNESRVLAKYWPAGSPSPRREEAERSRRARYSTCAAHPALMAETILGRVV